MVLKVSAAKLHATSGHISLIKKLIEPSPVSSRGERILCFPPKKKKKWGEGPAIHMAMDMDEGGEQ